MPPRLGQRGAQNLPAAAAAAYLLHPRQPPPRLLSDCWSATNRSATGELQPDPARFPSGIPALVAYLQPRGLGLGLYTCAGSKTCKYGRPGSYGNYRRDADTLIGWGVEYIKAGALWRPRLSRQIRPPPPSL